MSTSPAMHAMRAVLWETIKILFPLSVEPDDMIIPHAWRDRTYLREDIVHDCVIAHPEDFLAHHELSWAAKAAKLMNLQRELHTIEHKPNE